MTSLLPTVLRLEGYDQDQNKKKLWVQFYETEFKGDMTLVQDIWLKTASTMVQDGWESMVVRKSRTQQMYLYASVVVKSRMYNTVLISIILNTQILCTEFGKISLFYFWFTTDARFFNKQEWWKQIIKLLCISSWKHLYQKKMTSTRSNYSMPIVAYVFAFPLD